MADLSINFSNPNTTSVQNTPVAAPSFGGFVTVPTPNGGNNTLPSSNVQDWNPAFAQRNIISWFVPEYGVVKMYVNPRSITYANKKLIKRDRTKGGYTLQYWGEELTELRLQGSTGSSGIEGINVLYEIYRAEQLAFDTIGQALIANSSSNGTTSQMLGGISAAIAAASGSAVAGGLSGSVSGVLGAALALGGVPSNLAPRQITSLATLAFAVEMYYAGWVYRGFFQDMTVEESADHLGTMDYTISFTATQRRGYRLNTLPWQRSAIDGPSNNDLSAGGIPLSAYNLSGGP